MCLRARWLRYYIEHMSKSGKPLTLVERFIRFSGVGVIGTAAHYLVLILLVQLTAIDPVAASSLGALLGALVNYHLNYHYTFQSSKRHREALTRFMIVAVIAFILNALLMYGFTSVLQWHYLLAQILTTMLMLLWTFIANLMWSFRE